MNKFLPMTKKDLKERNWEQCDFIIITGDAYIDHPSFGTAIISRVLEKKGYKVGIISQPNWNDTKDFKKLGKPRLGFLINSGNIDSMVNHYTVNKKKRKKDAYTDEQRSDKRPDRAVIVYSNRAKEAYKDVPIIIGGVESSLRRFAHYDYWSNKVRRSIIFDSKADLLLYGMGEKVVIELAEALDSGMDIKYINYLRNTAYKTKDISDVMDYINIPSYEDVKEDKIAYANATRIQYEEQDYIAGKTIVQKHNDYYLVQNPPQKPLTQEEMDEVYNLNYVRKQHPSYKEKIKAFDEVKFSLVSERGCFGNCSFCAIALHQGRVIQTRSHESIIEEAKILIEDEEFKGYIHDVGGPTANFRHKACKKQEDKGVCKKKQCLFPKPCKNLNIDHKDYLNLLKKLRTLDRVKKVFVRSGLRYDYIMADKNRSKFLKELCEHHVSGQLKVAPEHISESVLSKMGKPGGKIFDDFKNEYESMNSKLGKKQFLVPYLMSSHPGSTLKDAIFLASYLKKANIYPEQVQDFYPTPGTISTAMFYTGIDPITMEKVYVPKDMHEKNMQRALLQFKNPDNYDLVYKALLKANRKDLIGYNENALIRPKNENYDRKNNSRFKKDDKSDNKSRYNGNKSRYNKKGFNKSKEDEKKNSKRSFNEKSTNGRNKANDKDNANNKKRRKRR